MITAVPATATLDELFQKKSIQDNLQLGTAMPMPLLQPTGEPVVVLCFHETSAYISGLTNPKFGINFGRFVVGNAHIFKLFLLIVLDDTGANYRMAEMSINWHNTDIGQNVIAALAAGAPLFLRCYGDQWTCEKLIRLPAAPGLETFAQAFVNAVKGARPWRAIDFEHASAFIDSKFTTEELMMVELPRQMAVFEVTGEFDAEENNGVSDLEESTEQRRARHSRFLEHNCRPLAAFGWEEYSKHGRGAIMVKQNGSGCKIRYVTSEEADMDENYDSIAVQIGKYDPDTAFVVAIDDSEDFYSSYIIGLPDLTPKMAFEQGLHKCLTV